MAKDKKGEQQGKSIEPIPQSDVNKQQAAPEDLQLIDDEPEFNLDDLAGLRVDSDVNVGSGSGLLDLSLQQDDTTFGGTLDEIYGEQEEPVTQKRGPSKKTLQARASLEAKVYSHDDIIGREGFRKVHNHYYTDGVRNILFSNDPDGKPRAFVFYGYSLKKIVPAGSTMKALQVSGNGKTAYQYLDQLATTYFKGKGVLGEAFIPSNKFSRVVFGYSVVYDPNDTDKLEPTLKSIVKAAGEKYNNMKLQIEKDLGQGTKISPISGQAAFDLYHLGVDKYRHLRNMDVIAEASGLQEGPAAAKPDAMAEAIQEVKQTYQPSVAKKGPGRLKRARTYAHNFLMDHT